MSATGLILSARAVPSRVAAGATLLIGLLTLTGWTFASHTLTSLLPGAVDMKPNTAVCFLCAGASLMILSENASLIWESIARGLGAVVVGVALATLCEYLYGWQLGIDQLLFRDVEARYASAPGRMSPYTALGLIAAGCALFSLKWRLTDRTARIAAALTLTVGLVSLIGYLWNAGELITDHWLPPVAANSALCLICLGGGIVLVPERRATDTGELAGVELRVLAGFLAAITLLVLGGSVTYRNSVEFANSVESIAHTQEVRATLSDLYGSLAGAEVAQREYFLSHAAGPLEESQRLAVRARARLERLAQLVADNPEQVENLKTLRLLAERRLQTLQTGMTAFTDYGLPALRAVLTLSRSQSTVEAVGAQRERMDLIEERLLKGRESQANRVRFTTLISLLATVTIAVCFFIVLFRGIHREMFARRDAERAMRRSDEYNRSIVENSPDCVAVLSNGAQITQMNPLGMQLLGIEDFAGVSGKDWCSFWEGADRLKAQAAVNEARNGREGRFDGRVRVAGTDEERWLDVIVNPVRLRGAHAERLLAVARDITVVKRGEDNLRSANQFLDSLIQALPLMVVVKDVETLSFVRVNRAVEELLGVSRDALIGKTAGDFFPPEEAQRMTAQDREAISCGRLLNIEHSVRTPHGTRSFHSMKLPIRDSRGQPQFLLAISVDVTERQLTEQAMRALNEAMLAKTSQLESTNKELESFSYSVSHDLRAPLRAIDGFAEILEEDYRETLDAEGKRYLSVIRGNSKRMGNLIDDLLAFSRLGRQAVTKADVNVDALVREVMTEVLNTESGHHDGPQAELQIVGQLPPVFGDRTLLRQVWINLLANAVKYSSKSPQPRIEVRGERVGEELQYSVRDNGVGFSMEYVGKLFGVFNRLHRADEFSGTGVGLAIVQRIVVRHGGRVWAEGKVGEGAVFSFSLPAGAYGG